MTIEKIKNEVRIKSISIGANYKDFPFRNYGDEDLAKKASKEIKSFKKDHFVFSETKKDDYCKTTVLHYYEGEVVFFPTKEGESSLAMKIDLSPDMLKMISVMCLDNVCNLCEKQTKAFQERFVKMTQQHEESLTRESKRIGESFLKRKARLLIGK